MLFYLPHLVFSATDRFQAKEHLLDYVIKVETATQLYLKTHETCIFAG